MKRYKICPDDMEEIYWEDKDGSWVKYDDAAREINKQILEKTDALLRKQRIIDTLRRKLKEVD